MAGERRLSADETAIDELLAGALRGEASAWPDNQSAALGVERILYHGVSGLIVARARDLGGWPSVLLEPAREQAIAQAMWEMRHKPLLAGLLAAFADDGITALLLKGSALAYDLYPAPSARARSDSDVLVAPSDLNRARSVLGRLGFERGHNEERVTGDLKLQEVWGVAGDGGNHHSIDLHWHLLNAPTLRKVMEFDACAVAPLALPRLGPGAMAMNRVATLVHTSIHRAMHITNPYFVDGVTYYGGDRLIWAYDIALLASALTDVEWEAFASVALAQGVATAALDGLNIASRRLGAEIPNHVSRRLGEAKGEAASDYLLRAGQARRSWSDLRAIGGFHGKIAYATSRALPSASFMRSKYPDMAARPLAALYARRVFELLGARPFRQ